jgi:hypothetical protein
MMQDKNLLVVYLTPPGSLGKSAQMLTLKYLRQMGWKPTVLAMPREDSAREPLSNWCGIDVYTLYPSRSRLWRMSQELQRARSQSKSNGLSPGGGERNGHTRMSRLTATGIYVALLPAMALSFPDRFRHAASELLNTARALHRERNFQAVVSIYDPFTAHLVARRLAEEMGLPWLPLIKDYYSKPDYLMPSRIEKALNWGRALYERSVLSKSATLLAVSDNMADYYQGLMPRASVKILRHCFDDEDFEGAIPSFPERRGIFTMLWLGVVHPDDEENVKVYLKALGELLRRGAIDSRTFKARFVGHGSGLVAEYASKYGCSEVLELVPQVPHPEAMAELRQATCMFYSQDYVATRRRLPEYLAARKPILVFPSCPGTMSERILGSYGAAAITSTQAQLEATLVDWYERFKAQGQLALPFDEEVVQAFSARRLAQELGEALETSISLKSM